MEHSIANQNLNLLILYVCRNIGLKPTIFLPCFVISFLLSVIICASFDAKGIRNISHQAIAQPMVITLTRTSSQISTATNNSILTYQNNSALGIAMQYPLNWKRIEVGDKALLFLPPSKNDGFSEKLTVAVFGINSSVSAGQLSSAAINNYGEQLTDFFIINSKPITLTGNPGYILTYTYTVPSAGTITAMDIGIKDGNKAYVISYAAQRPEYFTYAGAVEKMIESFRIIPV